MDNLQQPSQVADGSTANIPQAQVGQGSVMALARKAPLGSKKKPANQGMFSWIAGGVLNKDTLMLGTIVILILVIIGMSIFVIQAFTNPGVNVIFQREDGTTTSQSSTTDTTTTGDQTQTNDNTSTSTNNDNTSGSSLVTKDLSISMIAFEQDNIGVVLPSNARELPVSGVYSVPVNIKLEVEEGEELETALTYLFGQGDVVYKGASLRSFLDLSDIQVEVLETNIDVQIKLTGSLIAAGDLAPIYIKSQIEKTIENYSSNYIITLNGSTSDYNCFGDASGLCN